MLLYSYIIPLPFQLADAKDVMRGVCNLEGARLPVLTPNLKVGNLEKQCLKIVAIF